MHSQTFRTGHLLSHRKDRLHRCPVVLAVQGCSQIGSLLSFNRGNHQIPPRMLLCPHYHSKRDHRDPLPTRHTISKTYNPLWQPRFRHTSQASTHYPRCLMEQTGQLDNLCHHHKGHIHKMSRHSSSRNGKGHSQQTPCLLPRNNQGTGKSLLHSIQIRRRSPVGSSANHSSTPAHNRQSNHKIPGNRGQQSQSGQWGQSGQRMAVYHRE